ncbi:MAG TPA: DNA-processing protein DprA [Caldilineaceae bacterium]|nr:DNA-processing protein DprA [Caldilineaceae bacterium]
MSTTIPPKAYWIGFNKVAGIGPTRLAALLNLCGSVDAAWRASIQQMQKAGLDRRSQANLLEARRELDLAKAWQQVEQSEVTVLTWDDVDYPNNLREIDAPPPVLYVRGHLKPEDDLAIAIVGTRRASAYGREIAHLSASEFSRNNVTVVSGLALGIDAIAHKAALEAGGRTVAVLGSGVDQLYPAQNRELARQIIKQGALVSEYPLGTRPEANNFPPRNRIISGLSRGTVVVEAGIQSGSLITATFAAEQGRDVFAVPGSILHPGSLGCNTLIREGAIPFLSVNDVLDHLDLVRLDIERAVRQSVPTDPLEGELLANLSHEPAHVDDLVRRLAWGSAQVSSTLTMMELKGMVRHVGGMNYVLR